MSGSFCSSDLSLFRVFCHYFVVIVVLAMSAKKVSAKHSTDKKKRLITIVLKKEIVKNHDRGVCSGLNKPIQLKHINHLHFFSFKNP